MRFSTSIIVCITILGICVGVHTRGQAVAIVPSSSCDGCTVVLPSGISNVVGLPANQFLSGGGGVVVYGAPAIEYLPGQASSTSQCRAAKLNICNTFLSVPVISVGATYAFSDQATGLSAQCTMVQGSLEILLHGKATKPCTSYPVVRTPSAQVINPATAKPTQLELFDGKPRTTETYKYQSIPQAGGVDGKPSGTLYKYQNLR